MNVLRSSSGSPLLASRPPFTIKSTTFRCQRHLSFWRLFVAGRSKRTGPAAMFVDHFVDHLHESDGFRKSDNDFVVVGDVVLCERAAFAVFEPFLADLIAADVEV